MRWGTSMRRVIAPRIESWAWAPVSQAIPRPGRQSQASDSVKVPREIVGRQLQALRGIEAGDAAGVDRCLALRLSVVRHITLVLGEDCMQLYVDLFRDPRRG